MERVNLGASISFWAMRIVDAMVRGLAALGVHPNILTTVGVMINVGCCILFATGNFFWAGIVLIVANIFDMLDGNVARLTGTVTRFGGFLDSSLDRLSDMVAFLGIMIFYAGNSPHRSLLYVTLAGIAWIGSVLVSYSAARSEALGVRSNVGFLQRPERIVLLIIGALSTWDWNSDFFLFNRMPQVLWILAIGSIWTFVHRMIHIWNEFKTIEGGTSNG